MDPSSNQNVPVFVGAGLLATLGVWSALGDAPGWAVWPGVLVGLGFLVWGVWGVGRRRAQDEQDRLVSQAWALAEVLGQVRRGGGGALSDSGGLREALQGATEAVPALARAASEGRGLRDVIEAVGEPVVATDEAGRVTLVNRAAERMLGVRLDGRVRRVDDLIAQADVLGLYQAASEGRTVTGRVRLVTGDDARVFDTTASPLGSGRRLGVVLAFRDVTDLATAVLARTDFVANASHELRTPLTALRSAYDALGMAMDDPRMRERALQLMGSNLTRLEEMTRDLLDLSRVESPDARVRLSRVEIEDVVIEASSPFEEARRSRRLGLSIEIAPEARFAETDPRLVQEILRNLIDNACRFAHEGSTIRVVAEAIAPLEGDHGASEPERPGPRGTLRLSVIDRGIGIPLDQQARIFERFYQVDPARSGKRRGTGLGLSIVKHAARALGGRVDVESVWGQGTRMIVELPGALIGAAEAGGG